MGPPWRRLSWNPSPLRELFELVLAFHVTEGWHYFNLMSWKRLLNYCDIPEQNIQRRRSSEAAVIDVWHFTEPQDLEYPASASHRAGESYPILTAGPLGRLCPNHRRLRRMRSPGVDRVAMF